MVLFAFIGSGNVKKKNQLRLAVLCAVFSACTVGAWAADTAVGTGSGVAYGAGSNAPKAENVAIGKGATIAYSNGASAATGDVVIGNKAKRNNYVSQGGGIAIGAGAFSENMAGTQEQGFNFNQTTFTGSGFLGLQSPFIPADPTKMTSGIAIGQNSYARSGSVMLGTHNYKGDIADTNVDTASETSMRAHEVSVNATTIGANSFNNSAFGVVNGAYSAITGAYDGGGFRSNASQNFGATITGSLNSIESKTASSNYSGVGNSIVGVANREFNANGALIFGAGNEITNSVRTVSAPASSGNSPKALQQTLTGIIKNAEGGGSTMIIGGGNKADYTQKTQITGVNNTITGTAGKVAQLNAVSGFKNTITNASNNIVMGNDHTIKADNTVAIGGLSAAETRSVANTTTIGYDAKASVEGGVALGYKSNATVDKGAVGYDLSVNGPSSESNATWKATAAAVSVGDVTNGITRQITSVAAGTNDTDAVNVAQLKKAVANAIPGAASGPDQYTGDNGTSITINQGDNLNVKGGATEAADGNNIYVDAQGDTLNLKLAKDITGVNSITTKELTSDTVNTKTINVGDTITINPSGMDMGSTKITNLKAGDVSANSTDAVTGGQLYETNQRVQDNSNRIDGLGSSVNKLDHRLDKVGAGAAALAALHPLDFDPDAKWDFAAGYGNYAGANAAAIGAYYRPNEDLMFSVAGTMGNGENMVNAGVSLKVGGVKGVSKSRVALGKEVLALKQEVAELKSLLGAKSSAVTQGANRTTVFPDVPSNHWAYEAVRGLADRGLVEGYPDGTFGGDKMMTRYEFASIIYRAVQKGALVDEHLVKEFSPELALFRVDTIKQDKNGNPEIERVRVNHKK